LKEEILGNLDQQLIIFDKNLEFYNNILNIHFKNQANDLEFLSKGEIILHLNACENTPDLEFKIRQLLNENENIKKINSSNLPKDDKEKIIDDIETDLELKIAQQGANVIKDKLPLISAIPGQMNQLFYNLFSNALKFSKSDVPVIIHINCATAPDRTRSSRASAGSAPRCRSACRRRHAPRAARR
jgi:light-regulated signal transduction histidine kinase (bacteriophytochrome)